MVFEIEDMKEKQSKYDYYPEKLARIMQEHELIVPGQEQDFTRFVRGYC
jgi:hypothetical protein